MSSVRPCIVYQAPWDWDFLWNRAQPLAQALTAHADVLYLDCGDRSIESGWRSWLWWLRETFRARPSRVWSLLLPVFRYSRCDLMAPGLWRYTWRRWNPLVLRTTRGDRESSVYRQLQQDLLHRRDRGQPLWLLTSRPPAEGLLDLVPWSRIAADLEDPWPEMPWYSTVPAAVYQRLMDRANVVFANGAAIARTARAHYGANVFELPNGVAADFVEACAGPQPRPAWLPARDSPERAAVFTGYINNRIDFTLLREIASLAIGWNFFFVGSVALPPESRELWTEILATGRVVHVPAVAHSALPAILQHADALLLLYTPAAAAAMLPAKLLEYIAAARPILCNNRWLTEIYPANTFHVCEDARAVAGALDRIAAEPELPASTVAAARALAANHTWEKRAQLLFDTLMAGGCPPSDTPSALVDA